MRIDQYSFMITAIVSIAIGAIGTYLILEYRNRTEHIPIDPDTYKIEERIRIEREIVKPLQDSLDLSIEEIERLKGVKGKIRIIYKDRQNENFTLGDSASFNLLLERIKPTELLLNN